jgi:hypothetical protein
MPEHASQAIIGRGTLFQRGGLLSTDPYETVSEVISFGIPDEQADEEEVSHSESPDGYKEFIRSWIDGGEASVGLNWRPDLYATQASLRSDKADGLRRYYRFVLPGAMETVGFLGFVKGLKRNVTPKGAITADVSFRASRVTAA